MIRDKAENIIIPNNPVKIRTLPATEVDPVKIVMPDPATVKIIFMQWVAKFPWLLMQLRKRDSFQGVNVCKWPLYR